MIVSLAAPGAGWSDTGVPAVPHDRRRDRDGPSTRHSGWQPETDVARGPKPCSLCDAVSEYEPEHQPQAGVSDSSCLPGPPGARQCHQVTVTSLEESLKLSITVIIRYPTPVQGRARSRGQCRLSESVHPWLWQAPLGPGQGKPRAGRGWLSQGLSQHCSVWQQQQTNPQASLTSYSQS